MKISTKLFCLFLSALIVVSFVACSNSSAEEELRTQYGENKRITDGNYDESLSVKCINGTFIGKKTEGIVSYKGIPFVGRQPIGDLRWKAPVEIIPDDGVYEAYYYGKTPVQAPGDPAALYPMGEDCLYLNIWKADEAAAEKKPVIVWIYGGAFEVGGTTDPQYDCFNLVKENPDVIVVTIAYIWGESAGGASCTLLPLVKGSHQYFKRVISQSGAPNQTRTPEQAIDCTNKVMEALGCKTVADLQKISAEQKDEMNTFLGVVGVDVWNAWANERKAEKLAQLTDAGGKSYTYYFTVESSVPMIKSGHASEMSTVFNHPEINDFTGRAYDETFSKTMRKMWVQFAKTGNPSLNAEISPDGKAHEWPLYDLQNKEVMVLNESGIHPEKNPS